MGNSKAYLVMHCLELVVQQENVLGLEIRVNESQDVKDCRSTSVGLFRRKAATQFDIHATDLRSCLAKC